MLLDGDGPPHLISLGHAGGRKAAVALSEGIYVLLETLVRFRYLCTYFSTSRSSAKHSAIVTTTGHGFGSMTLSLGSIRLRSDLRGSLPFGEGICVLKHLIEKNISYTFTSTMNPHLCHFIEMLDSFDLLSYWLNKL